MLKEEREAIMVDMRKDGMSYRQIAEVVGVDPMTVYKKTSTVENSTVDNMPSVIVGKDGKKRSAKQAKRKAKLSAQHGGFCISPRKGIFQHFG